MRSGDHPAFSRITIPLPASQRWLARQTEQGVVLELPGFSGRFDTTDVFLRMGQSRITNIESSSSTLTLEVSCACNATAFRNGTLLVIDVADKGASLIGTPLEGPAIVATRDDDAPASKRLNAITDLPWIGGNSPFALFETAAAPRSREVKATHEALAETRSELLAQVQKNLIEEVANAATIGLLENSYQIPKSQTPPAKETVVIEPKELPDISQSAAENIRITSSRDLPSGVHNALFARTTSGLNCPSNEFLPIDTWATDASFSAQIGPARDALVNARDQLDKEAVKKLAQIYIYFGFGAEALDVLRLDTSLISANPQLAVVADVLEYGAARGRNPLEDFTDCSSSVALWATLGSRTIQAGARIDTNSALRTLNTLPKHLRQILAPILSDRFLQYGDAEGAASAMRSIERLPDALGPNAVLAQADLAIDAGEPAEVLLEKVIKANTPESPEALVKLVEGKLREDKPLSYETATLVEAYAQELRGTEIGNTLRRTQVIALSQSQHFTEAFLALAELVPSLSTKALEDLQNTVLQQLEKKAGDLVFLEHFFAQDPNRIEALTPQTKLLLAGRILDLGFAAEAQSMVRGIPDTPRLDARQILAGRAALMLRQPFQAQAALLGIDGEQAALLMAEAKEMAGAYREASEIFANNNARDQAAQAAWLADDWLDLTSPDTPRFGAIAILGQNRPLTEDPNLGVLGRADLALEESRAARNTLVQLLEDPAVQITPDS